MWPDGGRKDAKVDPFIALTEGVRLESRYSVIEIKAVDVNVCRHDSIYALNDQSRLSAALQPCRRGDKGDHVHIIRSSDQQSQGRRLLATMTSDESTRADRGPYRLPGSWHLGGLVEGLAWLSRGVGQSTPAVLSLEQGAISGSWQSEGPNSGGNRGGIALRS
jgi:hypothetical protein